MRHVWLRPLHHQLCAGAPTDSVFVCACAHVGVHALCVGVRVCSCVVCVGDGGDPPGSRYASPRLAFIHGWLRRLTQPTCPIHLPSGLGAKLMRCAWPAGVLQRSRRQCEWQQLRIPAAYRRQGAARLLPRCPVRVHHARKAGCVAALPHTVVHHEGACVFGGGVRTGGCMWGSPAGRSVSPCPAACKI